MGGDSFAGRQRTATQHLVSRSASTIVELSSHRCSCSTGLRISPFQLATSVLLLSETQSIVFGKQSLLEII